MTPVVDSHHHFWDVQRYSYPWMAGAAMDPIRRTIGPADLRPLLADTGVARTIMVQCLASLDETYWFLAVAGATDFVAGVVGWVDLTAPDVAATLAEVKASPHGRQLVGVRHQVHDEPDPNWLLRPDVGRGLTALAEAGLVYDLLLRPRELAPALAVVKAHPNLRFVIDHLAKPLIRAGELEPWATDLAPFANLPNVACKISGMVTEANWTAWTPNDLKPYVDRVIAWFGPDRLLFGSDWPVCELAATYRQVFDAAQTLTAGLSPTERAAVFGGNATRIYRLP